MANPLLGHIEEAQRNQLQRDLADQARKTAVKYALTIPKLAKGDKLLLTKNWVHPDVKADVGRALIREKQLTGSCVKVGGTNALRCTIASQRVAGENPTKAFEPYCWHNYAMSRHAFGEDGPGEGSLGSTFAASLKDDGVRDWPQDVKDQLPDYVFEGKHIRITAQQEMEWSSYRNPKLQAVLDSSRDNKLGAAGECKSSSDVAAMNLNGYGVTFACDRYIGNGRLISAGADSYVEGEWDGNGGHQQWVYGVWEHPTRGRLFAVGNNWDDDTYPEDPAGLLECSVWVRESKLDWALRNLNAEVFGLSHLNYFPATPKLLDYCL
jgi:hypothetical protein